MQQKLKLGLLLASVALLGMACQTTPTVPWEDSKAVKKTEYGSPADSVLVYGTVSQPKNLFNALSGSAVDNLEMIQVKPDKKPMFITPARDGDHFFTQPIPVGSSVRVFYFSTQEQSGRQVIITSYEKGLQGQSATNLRLDKPGLHYMGSLILEPVDKEAAKKFAILAGPLEMDLFPTGKAKEIDALKALLPKYRGTDWEPVITARIEELKK